MAHYLVIFGFTWILFSSILGIILSKRRELKLREIENVTTTDEVIAFYKLDWDYRWAKTRHAHSSLFSLICIVAGLALTSYGSNSPMMVQTIVIVMSLAVVLWTIFSARHFVPGMGLADIMLMVGLLLTGWLVVQDTLPYFT